MIRRYIFLLFLPLVLCAAIAVEPVTVPRSSAVSFIENRGQVTDADGKRRPDILYTAEMAGMEVYCTKVGLSYVLSRVDKTNPARAVRQEEIDDQNIFLDMEKLANQKITQYRMDVEFVGANAIEVLGEEATHEYFNYYYAHCPDGITNVHGYKKIVYRNLYPHIDFVLYTREGGLKYDFIVRPGGDPANIRLRYHGAEKLTCLRSGVLQVNTPLGSIEEQKPYTYQAAREITSCYKIEGTTVRFEIGKYDIGDTLVIDPHLVWSTYYGGASSDLPRSIITDGNNNIFVVGTTMSSDFPIQNAIQTTRNGTDDAFIAKFTPDGQRLWATYYGGTAIEAGVSIDATTDGRVVVAGQTSSTDFPVQNALQSTSGGARDMFVLTLSSDGQRTWATYLGGTLNESTYGVAIGADGTVGVLGKTNSSNMPVMNAYQRLSAGGLDAFIARISPAGQLVWSTYLGGSGSDGSLNEGTTKDLVMDAAGNIIVAGATTSANFPTRAAFQSTLSGVTNGFVTKFSSTGEMLWSTYYGGSQNDGIDGITIDLTGNIFICGFTSSIDFPLQDSFQGIPHGDGEGFIAKLNSSGQPLWSTYYGGSKNDSFWSITTDAAGSIYLTGSTQSTDFFLVNPWQPLLSGVRDVFILRFNTGGYPTWSTFFGGSNIEDGMGIAVDGFGSIIVTGISDSDNLPLLNSFQNRRNGLYDGFIAKFGCDIATPSILPGVRAFCEGDSVTLVSDGLYDSYLWSNGATTSSITVGETGVYWVAGYRTSDCIATSAPVTIDVFPRPVPEIDGSSFLCAGSAITLRTTKPFRSYRWGSATSTEVLSTSAILAVAEPGLYTVTVTDENGCTGTSATLQVISLPTPVTQVALTPPGKTVLCPGDSVVLTALGNFPSYKWSDGSTTASITVRGAGLYAVSVTDDNGCTSESVSQQIDVIDVPSDNISGPASLCIDSETTYEVQDRSGVSYVWTVTGGTVLTDTKTHSIRVRWTQAGNGTVMLTRSVGACSITSGPLEVLIVDKLYPIMTGPLELCNGEDIELGVSGVYHTYTWSDGTTAATLVVNAAGVYSVTVTNGDGCSGTTTVTIDAGMPAVSILGPSSVCFNSTAGYSADNVDAGYSFVWSVTGGDIVSGASTSTVAVQWGNSSTGSITLTVKRAGSNCVLETTRTVFIEESLRPVIHASSVVLCTGGESHISVDAGYRTYLWSTGATTADITVNTEGEYSVTVTDDNGCSGSTSVSISRRDVVFGQDEQLEWLNVTSGTVTDKTLVWRNEGTESVHVESVSFIAGLPEFSATFSPVLPADIPPGSTLTMNVRFQPQAAGTYEDNATITISSPCSLERQIKLSGTAVQKEVSVFASARLPDTTAYPWMRAYSIPLYLQFTSSETGEAQTVEFEVAMDSSVFFPKSLTHGVITGNIVDPVAGERIISGRVENVVPGSNETILTHIVGDVLLGERDNTVLFLRKLALADGTEGATKNGLLTLEGICREGDARFVRSTSGFGITIQPQPVQEVLTALVEVVEAGECSVELYSVDGRRELVRQWYHSAGSDGATIITYDVSSKGSGVYWLVLRTPTQTVTNQFIVVK